MSNLPKGIYAAYFFADEAEQLLGPYVSPEDAVKAGELYRVALLTYEEFTNEDKETLEDINLRRNGLILLVTKALG